jgi:hypothetical protein
VVASSTNVVRVDAGISLVGSVRGVRTGRVVVGSAVGGVLVLVEDVLDLGLDLVHGSRHDD